MTPATMLNWCIQHHADLHFSCLGTVLLFVEGLHYIERPTLAEAIQEAQELLAVDSTLTGEQTKQLLLLKEAS